MTAAAIDGTASSRPVLSARGIAARLGLPAPTDEQVAVIEAPLEPMLVVAGAGSGKTETMSARVVWLVANGLVEPDRVLGLTFTRKAAAELGERVRRRLAALRAVTGQRGHETWSAGAGPGSGEVTVSTYSAYSGRLVADHGLRLGVEPGARLLTEALAWQFAHAVVAEYDGDMSAVRRAPSTVVDAVLQLGGELGDHLVEPAALEAFLADVAVRAAALPRTAGDAGPGAPYADLGKPFLETVQALRGMVPLVEAFRARKRSREAVDFSDQTALAARLAALDAVAAAEREQYSVVLLDEYQDTGHAQLVMLERLFGAGHPVTAVGDPCQSIYGWRGASAGTLRRFPTDFRRSDGRAAARYELATSWRNDGLVLDAANRVSAPLRAAEGPGGAAAASLVPVLVPRPEAGPGRVEVGLFATYLDEAEAVADVVAEEWAHRAERPGPSGEPATVAVLARKRSQFPVLAEALRSRGLPVEVVGLGGLLTEPEVADVVATLRVIVDSTAGHALMRLLAGARWRIGPRDLEMLGRWGSVVSGARPVRAEPAAGEAGGTAIAPLPDEVDERSIVEALDALPPAGWHTADGRGFSVEGYARLSRLSRELRGLRSRTWAPLPDLVVDVERVLGLDVEVAARPGGAGRAHLDALLDVAGEFSEEVGARGEDVRLEAFLAFLQAAEERERGLEPGQVERVVDAPGAGVVTHAVSVLTVHAAKGLEWDVVAVPGLVDGDFPAGRATDGGWTTGVDSLPFPLRGDRDALPELALAAVRDQRELRDALRTFRLACGDRQREEERRLAYVALTRARRRALLTGHRWGTGVKPRTEFTFLEEVASVDGVVAVTWAEADPPDTPNPTTVEDVTALWPVDPLGVRRPALVEAARLVEQARAGGADPDAVPVDTLAEVEVVDDWRRDVDVLLAEAARRRSDVVEVELPEHLSVSRLVALRADPDELARAVRRPMPARPRPAARRGTAFHAWLEARFGQPALLEPDELAGSADEQAAPDHELERLKAAFLSGEWADRTPVAGGVEPPFEMPVGGVLLRGRMDAVFPTGDGGFEVVDWKTGPPPDDDALSAAAVQLAVYRLAWAALAGVPVERVSAAFHYVAAGVTLRPADLLDADELAGLVAALPEASAAKRHA